MPLRAVVVCNASVASAPTLTRTFASLSICAQKKTGKVLSIDLKGGKVVVEGVNVRTKHVKPMKEGESGSLLKKEMPIAISNVALSDEQPAVAAAPASE